MGPAVIGPVMNVKKVVDFGGTELEVRQYSPAPLSVKGTETVSGLSQVRPGMAVGVGVLVGVVVGVGVGVAVGVGIIIVSIRFVPDIDNYVCRRFI